ncbi:MAG: AMP-binding protein [Gammaproteobacteria bacterium]
MPDELIPLSSVLSSTRRQRQKVARHRGHDFDAGQFSASVGHWVTRLRRQPCRAYALYTLDAYPFAVLLMALLHAGKEIWIPGNGRPGTAEQLRTLGCRLIGDWSASDPFDYRLDCAPGFGNRPAPLLGEDSKLVMFTSGSTGEARPVEKRLCQLEIEIAALEKQWGGLIEKSRALSTVSHQHIYGLLFRVLWPLSAGRCFQSEIYLTPESLAAGARHSDAYWIASPAQLKRLDRESPWSEIADLKGLFSSGGPLPTEAAKRIWTFSRQPVIEIYGSTETGGIAWRQQKGEEGTHWTLFDGMSLAAKNSQWLLHSPYLSADGVLLDDRIRVLENGLIEFLGRSDRLVKIEEKRLSLTEIELRLAEMSWVSAAYAAKLNRHRDMVGVVLELSPRGADLLKAQGRRRLVDALRKELSHWFEAVVLPRRWLFSNRLPLTPQGKIDPHLIFELLNTDTDKKPRIDNLTFDEARVELKIRVPEELIYFPDHFQGFPILPGVVQIAWAEHYGKLFFPVDLPFLRLEVIKFVKLIRPGDELTLALEWQLGQRKLCFSFGSKSGLNSSGRLVYGVHS